jgi:hypothetical protein
MVMVVARCHPDDQAQAEDFCPMCDNAVAVDKHARGMRTEGVTLICQQCVATIEQTAPDSIRRADGQGSNP